MSSVETVTLAELLQRGEQLGRSLPPHSIVWLEGPLGAGKTTMARAILAGHGVKEAVASPTYSLVHHHVGPAGACYHLDCYRLRDPDEAGDLDWETLSHADVLLIEWPERAGVWAPRPTHHLRLDHVDDTHRMLTTS